VGHQLTVGGWVVGTAGGTAGGSVELSVTVDCTCTVLGSPALYFVLAIMRSIAIQGTALDNPEEEEDRAYNVGIIRYYDLKHNQIPRFAKPIKPRLPLLCTAVNCESRSANSASR